VKVRIVADAAAQARLVADLVEQVVRSTPRPVLGLATGSSPLATYAELVRRHRAEGLAFEHCRVFLLDEYVGLTRHEAGYRSQIRRVVTDAVGIPPDAVQGPDGDAADLDAACAAYEDRLRASGGVDLQVLGIGADGHIGFNEPASALGSRTRPVVLTARTRADNARHFDHPGDVPRLALTQGIGTILEARHLVLLAAGAAKAEPVARALEGPITAMVPASALQLHPRVTVVLDDAAATDLRLADHHREVSSLEASHRYGVGP
jgi:glucosamine-6-phosphate deaminase